jgi:hypothetical protein
MRTFFLVVTIIFCSRFGFSQNGIEKLKELTNTLTQPQDTSKSSSTGSGQSNLAVSDEGASGGKGKSNARENPIKKLKHNLTEKAVKVDSTSGGSSGNGTSNLAVSDEGAGGTKGKPKTSSRENNSSTPLPSPTDPPKTGTSTEGPK